MSTITMQQKNLQINPYEICKKTHSYFGIISCLSHMIVDAGAKCRERTFYTDFAIVDSPAKIRKNANATWEGLREFTGYTYQRHLFKDPAHPHAQTYNSELPTFHKLPLVTLIQKELDRRQKIVGPGKQIDPIIIVDIGYGSGLALLDMKEKWGENVFVVGYGTSALAKRGGDITSGNAELQPTYERLLGNGIHLVEGNVVDIREILKETFGKNFHADFLTLCYVAGNVHYPPFELLKKLYRVLQPPVDPKKTGGGVLLMNQFHDLIFEANQNDRLFAHLQSLGYLLENQGIKGISLQKTATHPDLPANIRTIQPEHIEGVDLLPMCLRRSIRK